MSDSWITPLTCLRPQTADIDPWGNPTAPATNLGKAVPVTIQMRVFKNDDK